MKKLLGILVLGLLFFSNANALPKYKHSLLIEAPDEVAKNLIQFMSKFKIK